MNCYSKKSSSSVNLTKNKMKLFHYDQEVDDVLTNLINLRMAFECSLENVVLRSL